MVAATGGVSLRANKGVVSLVVLLSHDHRPPWLVHVLPVIRTVAHDVVRVTRDVMHAGRSVIASVDELPYFTGFVGNVHFAFGISTGVLGGFGLLGAAIP